MTKTTEQLYREQLEAEKAQLTADYNNAVFSLDAQKKENEKQVRENIALAKADNQMASVNNAEYYAAAGLTSGAKAQADFAQANQHQRNVTALRAAQQEADNAVELQRQNLANQYAAAIKQAQADNDMALAEALYENAKKLEDAKTEPIEGSLINPATNVVDTVVNAIINSETVKPTKTEAIKNLDKFVENLGKTSTNSRVFNERLSAEINRYLQAGAITLDQAKQLLDQYTHADNVQYLSESFMDKMDKFAEAYGNYAARTEVQIMLDKGQITSEQANFLNERYKYQQAGGDPGYNRVSLNTIGLANYPDIIINELIQSGQLIKYSDGTYGLGPNAVTITGAELDGLQNAAQEVGKRLIASGKLPVDVEQLYSVFPGNKSEQGLKQAIMIAELQNKPLAKTIYDFVTSHGYEFYVGKNGKIQVKKRITNAANAPTQSYINYMPDAYTSFANNTIV